MLVKYTVFSRRGTAVIIQKKLNFGYCLYLEGSLQYCFWPIQFSLLITHMFDILIISLELVTSSFCKSIRVLSSKYLDLSLVALRSSKYGVYVW